MDPHPRLGLQAPRRSRLPKGLAARWASLRDGGLREAVLASVDASARTLRPAVGRNFRRWPILDRRIWQNPAARGSFTAEVAFLRRWLDARMAWLDRATRYPRR